MTIRDNKTAHLDLLEREVDARLSADLDAVERGEQPGPWHDFGNVQEHWVACTFDQWLADRRALLVRRRARAAWVKGHPRLVAAAAALVLAIPWLLALYAWFTGAGLP